MRERRGRMQERGVPREFVYLSLCRLQSRAVVVLCRPADSHRAHIGDCQLGDGPGGKRQPRRRLTRHGSPDQAGTHDGKDFLEDLASITQVPAMNRSQFVKHHHLILGQDDEIRARGGKIADDR